MLVMPAQYLLLPTPALHAFDCSADPHPGNLIRTPDGRLAILDFGLMTQVDDDIKFGMIEAISHLIHRDYEAIVQVSSPRRGLMVVSLA
jgi:predicted unusual protein kinase regulating ubiquinone biosynthesis (AarF/ABC1/UbiB family)